MIGHGHPQRRAKLALAFDKRRMRARRQGRCAPSQASARLHYKSQSSIAERFLQAKAGKGWQSTSYPYLLSHGMPNGPCELRDLNCLTRKLYEHYIRIMSNTLN